MFYTLIKKFLFLLPTEMSHHAALKSLQLAHTLKLTFFFPIVSAPRTVMGLTFQNPIGLAAGLDKNGDYIDALAALGFGFIEIGTVTPKPQPGNPKPRLFRLVKDEALINRLGFNNKGVDYLIERVKQKKFTGILGINIGKNRDTPIEKAEGDYLYCLQKTYPHADYITINISSPNTSGLRDLQQSKLLKNLLHVLKAEQKLLADKHQKYVPLVVKISPDLSDEELSEVAEVMLAEKIDAVIATNTTLGREHLNDQSRAKEIGGLSGKPLKTRSTHIIKKLNELLQNQIPIIACGGVFTKADAAEKLTAGASLIQVYTGFIYRGPQIVQELAGEQA
jgi:dihydroorotate dehydrogenase